MKYHNFNLNNNNKGINNSKKTTKNLEKEKERITIKHHQINEDTQARLKKKKLNITNRKIIIKIHRK